MSLLTRSVKTRMAGLLQNMLRKLGDAPPRTDSSAGPEPAAATPPTPAPATQTPPTKVVPLHRNAVHHNGKGIELPLQPILAGLPLELQPHLKRADAGALTISVPLEKILAQLSSGAVRIPFGDLRYAAPDLFTLESDRDQVLVSIPLAEVLPRLNPALIKRRREQRLVEVPAEIRSPFDQHGQGLIFSVGPTQAEAAPAPPPRHTVPAKPPVVANPSRSAITFAPPPTPPGAPPLSTPKMSPASRPVHELGGSKTPPAPMPAPQSPKPATHNEPLAVGLSSLAEAWPEAVRKEIVQLKLVDAKVALPAEVVERALKQGRVAFTWKALRSWIRPAPLPAVSAHDSNVLELPLKIVAPLFLARQQEANKTQKKVTIDEDIPNLFFGFPQPESGSTKPVAPANPTGPKPPDTNYYIWDDDSDRVPLRDDAASRSPSPGTRFVAKYATPNEVVSRAAALDGVAGALIALPDGLMVASRLSSDLNGDTLAAFLPQIFAKVNQCTKELRMGELNNLNFTVGNVPWKIFRVHSIFFAAFGRAAQPLPTAQLAALAAELDHKPK
jgi:predicted regulator of Ras-like GTPase activity (Roadblock/LC7/MglB family)